MAEWVVVVMAMVAMVVVAVSRGEGEDATTLALLGWRRPGSGVRGHMRWSTCIRVVCRVVL